MLHRVFYRIGLLLCLLLLSACRNEEGEQAFVSAVEINKLGVKSLSVRVLSGGNVIEAGTSTSLGAFAIVSDGSELDVTDKVVWSSTDAAVIGVTSSGLATAGSLDGSASAKAVWGSLSASALLRVSTAALVSIDFDSPPSTVSECTLSTTYKILGHYADRSVDITHLVSSWLSSDVTLADVSAEGQLKAISAGSVTITANYGSESATHIQGINDDLLSLSISPAGTLNIEVNASQQFSAEGVDGNGARDVTQVATFNSNDTSLVSFAGAAGLATAGSSTGSTSITAECGGEASNTVLASVTQVKSVNGLVIRYQSSANDPAGPFEVRDSPIQLQAFLTYNDSSELEVTNNDDLVWSISSTISGTGATVSNSGGSEGEVRFTAVGRTEIKAVYDTNDEYQESSIDILVE
jgi:hypothetical protein